jgi:beta-phosphoglucomutase family hydrolase
MSTDSIKAVIFDLDGVLVDTGEFHKQSWYDLADREGFALTEEFFYGTFGMQNYQIIPQLVPEVTPAELERMSVWKEIRFRELIHGKLNLLDGAKALIEDLKHNHFKLAVGSSAPKVNLEFMLTEAGAYDDFDALVCGENVENGKPAPDTFLKAAEKLQIPPQRSIVIEDAVQGIQAAHAAGMAAVAITTTRLRADLNQAERIIDSLMELSPAILYELLNSQS